MSHITESENGIILLATELEAELLEGLHSSPLLLAWSLVSLPVHAILPGYIGYLHSPSVSHILKSL